MKILFTGGGTAGHVMVNKILIPFIQKKDPGCRILYIGSRQGIEKSLISALTDVDYYSIHTGKLRRYFSFRNITDIFNVLLGFLEAFKILKKERPQLVYSGGGYVIAPVVWAAALLKIPVLLRETDCTVGLANRLCMPFSSRLYTAFPDTPHTVHTIPCIFPGMIIRPELYEPHSGQELRICPRKPTCLIAGGSQGAMRINTLVWSCIPQLTAKYNIIHLCGHGKCNPSVPDSESYRQLEFAYDMAVYLSVADLVITRCGSNATAECLCLGKRMVCIPLTSRTSRGEQEQNAEFAVKYGNAVLLPEAELSLPALLTSIEAVLKQHKPMPYAVSREQMIQRITQHAEAVWAMAAK